MNPPDTINLFRMVHYQNVPYILEHGMCCREHPKADPNYINIGHRQLISDRHQFEIPIPGAGFLGEYVPFYFAGHTPMLFLIMNGLQGVERRKQEDIVFVKTSFERIQSLKLDYLFTDKNAKIKVASFYQSEEDFEQLRWDVIKDRVWRNTESDLSRKDCKQAEFLVKNHVPAEAIEALIVKTTRRKEELGELIVASKVEIPIFVDTKSKLFY